MQNTPCNPRNQPGSLRLWGSLLVAPFTFAAAGGCSPGELRNGSHGALDAGRSDERDGGSFSDSGSFSDGGLSPTDAGPLPHGDTYYVAKTGSDSNSCSSARSESTPKLTINAGAGCLRGGDTLIVKAGQYDEYLLDLLPPGTSSAPTIMKANGDAFAGTGDAVEIRPPDNPHQPIVRLSGSWIVLDGVIIDGRNQSVYMYIVTVEDGSSHVTIQNSEIRNSRDTCDAWGSGGAGITTGHHTNHTVLRRNHVHHISRYGGKKCESQTVHGLYTTGSDEVVEDNIIHDNAGWGIHYYATEVPSNNNTVRRNIVYNNDNTGIMIGSGDGNEAYNNVIYRNGRGLIMGRYGLGASNSSAYNNTLYDNSANCIITKATGSTIRNNISWQNGNDVITDEGTNTAADHNMTAMDPHFVNAAANDFRLGAGSPAIDVGIVVPGLSYSGSAPDLGALEWNADGAP